MSIFLDIEPVPFRLLDDLMMRMEGNNDRLRERLGDKSSTARPTPQRPAHNAEDSTYRRPEPAAHPRGTKVACAWIRQFNEGSGPTDIYQTVRIYSTDGTVFVDADLAEGEVELFQGLTTEQSGSSSIVGSTSIGGGIAWCGTVESIITGSRTITRTDRLITSGTRTMRTILPAGRDQLVVLLRRRSYSSLSTAVRITTQEYEPLVVPDGCGEGDDGWTWMASGSGSVSVTNDVRTAQGVKAYLVGKTFVREIPAPDFAETLFTDMVGGPAGNSPPENPIAGVTPSYDVGDGLDGPVTVFNSLPSRPFYTVTQARSLDYGTTAVFYDYSLGLSIGLGNLTTGYHPLGIDRAGTPVVFDFIAGDGREFQGITEVLDYDAMPDGYRRPPYYLATEWDGVSTIEIFKQRQAPTSIYEAMDKGPPVRSAFIVKPSAFADEANPSEVDYVLAWDYDRPGVAKGALRALGVEL
jgi:hypothetical protein